MDEVIVFLFKQFVRLYGFFQGKKFRHSQIYEDNYTYMDRKEMIWYGYKYLVRQIENGEIGKNIEGYFAAQDLAFETEGFEEKDSVVLSAGGDIITSDKLFPENCGHLWDDVGDYFFDADIVYANLETPLVPGRAPGCLGNIFTTANLNNTPEMFEKLSYKGKRINFFSTANNHSLDQGEDGLFATIDFLRQSGCGCVGTAKSREEQSDIPIVRKNNINIAFLAYTYAVNGKEPEADKSYLVNYIRLNKPDTDISMIREHADIARKKGADIVVACLHWGTEYESFPYEIEIDMGHRIIESGVDIILGNHAHTIEPMEKYIYTDAATGEKKQGFIAYALGDLMPCLSYDRNSLLANLIKLKISKGLVNGREETRITGLKSMPVYSCARWNRKNVDKFILLDLLKLLSEIEAGKSPYAFSKKDLKEIRHFGELAHKVIPHLEELYR